MLLDTKPLSRSLDSLNMADSEPLSLGLMGSIKGGGVPKNRAEAMRAYKGGSKSRHNSGGSASTGFGSDSDVLMIGSVSKASMGSTQGKEYCLFCVDVCWSTGVQLNCAVTEVKFLN